jgi:hypothetical protein
MPNTVPEAVVKARDFLPVITFLAEMLTLGAIICLGQSTARPKWRVGFRPLADIAEQYNQTLMFIFVACSACVFFLSAILIRFRSPLRGVLCVLLGLCLIFALTMSTRYLEWEQRTVRNQEPELWGALLIMLCTLGLHQAAFVAVCLLSPAKAVAERNPQVAEQDSLGRQSSEEHSQ